MPNDNKQPVTPGTTTPQADDQLPPIVFAEDALPPMPQPAPQTPTEDIINPSPSTTGSAAPTNDVTTTTVTDTVMPAVVTSGPKKKFASGKVIATILGLFLLVGGLGAGLVLTQQKQNVNEKAAAGCDVKYYCTKNHEIGATTVTYDSSLNQCGVTPAVSCGYNLTQWITSDGTPNGTQLTTGVCYNSQAEAGQDPYCQAVVPPPAVTPPPQSQNCTQRYFCYLDNHRDTVNNTTASTYDTSTNLECNVAAGATANTCNNNLGFHFTNQTTNTCYNTEAERDAVCPVINTPAGVDVAFSCIPGRANTQCLNNSKTWDGSSCIIIYCPNGDTNGDHSCSASSPSVGYVGDTGATAEAGSCIEMLNRVTTFPTNKCYQIDTVVSLADNTWCDLTQDRGSYCNGYQSNLRACGGLDVVNPTTGPTPTTPPTGTTAQCQNIKAYDGSWTLLSANDLSKLKAGNQIVLCATGSASSGSFDKAKFTVNGVAQSETSSVKPGTLDFCQLYTIPAQVSTFNVSAQMHHVTLGWL